MLDGIKNFIAVLTGSTSEVKETAKTATKEVQSAQAQELNDAKTDENTQTSVEIEGNEKKEKGFFGKLWDKIKAPFTGDKASGKILGGVIGGLLGGIAGICVGLIAGGKVQEKETQNTDNQPYSKTYEEDGMKICEDYDENGNMVKRMTTNKQTGKIYTVSEYEYDKNGNLVKESIDNSPDNNSTLSIGNRDAKDRVVYYEYDKNGNLVKESIDHRDNGIDQVKYIKYDENGNIARKDVDNNNDGTIDWIES